jgi:hypothetical protein
MRFHALIAGVCATLVASAEAATGRFYSGAACLPSTNSTANDIRSYGAVEWNSSGSTGIYDCPATGYINVNNATTAAQLYFDDRNSSASVVCFVEGQTLAKTQYTSSTRFGCSTAGGCGAADDSFTGTGYIGWTNPLNGGSNITTLVGLAIYCNVPPQSGGTNSSITGYYHALFDP